MRAFFDATAADGGGLGTYALGMLGAWGRAFPNDPILVAAGAGTPLAGQRLGPSVEVREVHASPGQTARRLAAINLRLCTLARQWDADLYLSLLPQLPLHLDGPAVAFVHDFWHERRPADFSPGRRMQRRLLYAHAYRRADRLIALSERTLADLAHLHPAHAAKTRVVLPGADHVDQWLDLDTAAPEGCVVAFGHHSNKRPDLAVDGWRHLRAMRAVPPLAICGLAADLLDRLRPSPPDDDGDLLLRSYVPGDAFRHMLRSARVVLFTSVFEGFGLPVIEAMRLGVPVAICPDPALLEAAGGHAAVAEGWSAPSVAQALGRALDMDEDRRRAARRWAASFTWERTARSVHDVACELLEDGTRS